MRRKRLALCLTSVLTAFTPGLSLADGIDVHYLYPGLPQHLQWQDHQGQSIGAEQAQPGGIFRQNIRRFPLHIRRIGDNANQNFSATLNRMQLPLIARHPISNQWQSMLASRWAIDAPTKQIFFELDENARWSDGVQVTSDDIVFTLQFLTNPDNGTRFQNQNIRSLIRQIEIYSDRAFAITSYQAIDEQILAHIAQLRPLAKHFYRAYPEWPDDYHWRAEPTTGPYYIANVHPQQQIILRRTNPWWGDERDFFRHRFNPSKIIYRLNSNGESSFNQFEMGIVDSIDLHKEINWRSPRLQQLAEQKRITRLMFYHQGRTRYSGLVLNHQHSDLETLEQRQWLIDVLTGQTNSPEAEHQQQRASELQFTLLYSSDSELPHLQALSENAKAHDVLIKLQKTTSQALLEVFNHNRFQLAWITMEGTPDNPFSALLNINHSLNSIRAGIEQKHFAPGPSKPFSRHAFWEWIRLPADIGFKRSSDFLSPIDLDTGGMFWIDQKMRANILARPQRRNHHHQAVVIDTFKQQ